VQRTLRGAITKSTETIFYRPWVWLLANLLLLAALPVLAPRRVALVALGGSGLAYELALFFLAPSADYRYSHWLVMSTWVLLAAVAVELRAHLAGGRFKGVGRPVSGSR
jgi:hypothetical protein